MIGPPIRGYIVRDAVNKLKEEIKKFNDISKKNNKRMQIYTIALVLFAYLTLVIALGNLFITFSNNPKISPLTIKKLPMHFTWMVMATFIVFLLALVLATKSDVKINPSKEKKVLNKKKQISRNNWQILILTIFCFIPFIFKSILYYIDPKLIIILLVIGYLYLFNERLKIKGFKLENRVTILSGLSMASFMFGAFFVSLMIYQDYYKGRILPAEYCKSYLNIGGDSLNLTLANVASGPAEINLDFRGKGIKAYNFNKEKYENRVRLIDKGVMQGKQISSFPVYFKIDNSKQKKIDYYFELRDRAGMIIYFGPPCSYVYNETQKKYILKKYK